MKLKKKKKKLRKDFYSFKVLHLNKFGGCKYRESFHCLIHTLAFSLEAFTTRPCDAKLNTIDRLIGCMDNGIKPFLNTHCWSCWKFGIIMRGTPLSGFLNWELYTRHKQKDGGNALFVNSWINTLHLCWRVLWLKMPWDMQPRLKIWVRLYVSSLLTVRLLSSIRANASLTS